MSAEAFAPSGLDFRAGNKTETSRGTEVRSNTADKIVEGALRVAAFLDRFKGGVTETAEVTKDAYERGKVFLAATGEKAIGAAIDGGKFVAGATLLGLETVGQGIVNTGNAIKETTTSFMDAAEKGAETVGFRADMAVTQFVDSIVADHNLQKFDRNASDASRKADRADRTEMQKAIVEDARFAASMRKKARNERWAARLERGKELFHGGVESAKFGGRVVRRIGNQALASVRDAVEAERNASLSV